MQKYEKMQCLIQHCQVYWYKIRLFNKKHVCCLTLHITKHAFTFIFAQTVVLTIVNKLLLWIAPALKMQKWKRQTHHGISGLWNRVSHETWWVSKTVTLIKMFKALKTYNDNNGFRNLTHASVSHFSVWSHPYMTRCTLLNLCLITLINQYSLPFLINCYVPQLNIT